MANSDAGKILVVDDEQNTRIVLKKLLKSQHYDVALAKDGPDALECLARQDCDVMLIDYKMPGMDGIELARRVRDTYPDIATVIVTAHGTIDMAVQAMKQGVLDYLTKPVDPDELLVTVQKAVEHKRLHQQVDQLREQLAAEYEFSSIIGKSKAMQDVFALIAKAAQTDVTVFIQGETGSGKELVARAIHYNSARKDGPLVPISCVAFQESLLESELFGHVHGAFTGAIRDKPGRFEMAHEGTLFLDEIDLIPASVQAKLLRVLEDRTFERVGGTEKIEVDIRLISSSNIDLREEVAKGEFREDLYHRVNVLTLALPPLRERTEDIPLLMQHFLAKANEKHGKRVEEFAPEVIQRFFLYPWPGNVRELENAVSSAVVLCEGNAIQMAHVPPTIRVAGLPEDEESSAPAHSIGLTRQIDVFERQLIMHALARANQNTTEAANILGVSPRTLRNKINKHRLRS